MLIGKVYCVLGHGISELTHTSQVVGVFDTRKRADDYCSYEFKDASLIVQEVDAVRSETKPDRAESNFVWLLMSQNPCQLDCEYEPLEIVQYNKRYAEWVSKLTPDEIAIIREGKR